MLPDQFHAVKKAAVESAMQRYGVDKLGSTFTQQLPRALRGVGSSLKSGVKSLFSAHPLQEGGYGAGVMKRIADARAAKGTLKQVGQAGLKGLGESGKNVGHQVGEFFRAATFGSPVTVVDKLKDRHKSVGSWPKAFGGYAKDFYIDPDEGLLSHAVSLGIPTYDLYQTYRHGDPNQRGGDYGGALTELAVAPFTARLGIPGMLAQGYLQRAGRRVGSLLDPKTNPEENVAAHYDPVRHGKLTIRGMAAGNGASDVTANLPLDLLV